MLVEVMKIRNIGEEKEKKCLLNLDNIVSIEPYDVDSAMVQTIIENEYFTIKGSYESLIERLNKKGAIVY